MLLRRLRGGVEERRRLLGGETRLADLLRLRLCERLHVAWQVRAGAHSCDVESGDSLRDILHRLQGDVDDLRRLLGSASWLWLRSAQQVSLAADSCDGEFDKSMRDVLRRLLGGVDDLRHLLGGEARLGDLLQLWLSELLHRARLVIVKQNGTTQSVESKLPEVECLEEAWMTCVASWVTRRAWETCCDCG